MPRSCVSHKRFSHALHRPESSAAIRPAAEFVSISPAIFRPISPRSLPPTGSWSSRWTIPTANHRSRHKHERRTADRRRVSDPGIRALYRIENRWQAWLDVEVALARAQAELGIIPNEVAEAIAAAARLDLLDRKRIDEGLARTGHTIVPLVWELSRIVGEPYGGWVHWGATTQNIT